MKKLFYCIAVVSMIAPLAVESFNPNVVEASTKGHVMLYLRKQLIRLLRLLSIIVVQHLKDLSMLVV